MHIIFGYVTYWQIPILITFKFFRFKVFYIHIKSNTDHKKNIIATKLKKYNIFPLPLEFQEKLNSKKSLSLCECDPDEVGYKKNLEIVPDKILNKYCDLFSIEIKEAKKLRILFQSFVFDQQMLVSGILGTWSALNPDKKIIYVSFDFKCFYNSDASKNVYKIIIPLTILGYIKKVALVFFLKFKIKNYKKKCKNDINLNDITKKTTALIPNKGIIWGTKEKLLFEKTLYYSEHLNSVFNKYNILHLDYSNFPRPEENILWVSLNKIEVSKFKILSKTFLASLKTFYLVRSWSTFLGWVLCLYQYYKFEKYYDSLKEFKNLKLALIDYDIVCPKTLILALQKKKIKVVTTQERFVHTFFTSYATVITDTYFTASEYTANFIKNSKYFYAKEIIPMGQPRSDYLNLFKKNSVPKTILEARDRGMKILVLLAFHSPDKWYESHISMATSWSAQIEFLEDAIKLASNLKNTFIILRYKGLDWPLQTEKYFKNTLEKINDCKNIILSNNYSEPMYSYKLCANADLIIAKHTSIADECLSQKLPVLFYDYSHNMDSVQSDAFNYEPTELMCHNFEDLLKRSKSLLFDSSSQFKDQINLQSKEIYFVKEQGNIKNKIITHLENLVKNDL